MNGQAALERFAAARPQYRYCGICGHTPGERDEPNRGPLRYWEPDDGWTIGTLCRWCAEEYLDTVPSPDDYAYRATNGVCDNEDTDEDILEAL